MEKYRLIITLFVVLHGIGAAHETSCNWKAPSAVRVDHLIQNEIDSGSRHIYIPEGNWQLNNTVLITSSNVGDSGITIEGTGPGSSLSLAGDFFAFKIDGAKRVTFRGIKFVNFDTSARGGGVEFTGGIFDESPFSTELCTISDCFFSCLAVGIKGFNLPKSLISCNNFSSCENGIRLLGRSIENRISSNVMLGRGHNGFCTGIGIEIYSTDLDGNRLPNSVFTTNGPNFDYLVPEGTNILGNITSGYNVGIQMHAVYYGQISDNGLDSMYQHCFNISYTQNVNISNNTMLLRVPPGNSGTIIHLVHSALLNINTNNIEFNDNGIELESVTHLDFKDNRMIAAPGYQIHFSSDAASDNLKIMGNRFHSPDMTGTVISIGANSGYTRTFDNQIDPQWAGAANIPPRVKQQWNSWSNVSNFYSNFFNEAYYLQQNPDIKALVQTGGYASGWEHFKLFGILEYRNPNNYLDLQTLDCPNYHGETDPVKALAALEAFLCQ